MSFANVGTVISESTERFNIKLEDPEKNDFLKSLKISAIKNPESNCPTFKFIWIDYSKHRPIMEKAFRKMAIITTFNSALVQEVGSIHKVLTEFLDNQTKSIQNQLEKEFPKVPPQGVQSILNAFATLDGTKKPLKKSEIQIPNLSHSHIEFTLINLKKLGYLG